MNFTPWSGSNFVAAVTSPTLPSWMRSRKDMPRFWYFLATEITNRRFERMRSSRAAGSPACARRAIRSSSAGERSACLLTSCRYRSRAPGISWGAPFCGIEPCRDIVSRKRGPVLEALLDAVTRPLRVSRA